MLTDESVIEEADMKGFWRNLFLCCFDGSVSILTIGRLSWIEVCQVLYRSTIFVQNKINIIKIFKCNLFSFTKSHKKAQTNKKKNHPTTQNYQTNQTTKATWMLNHPKSGHFGEKVVSSTVLPVCLELHSKYPLPNITRPRLSPLGIILCLKRLMLYMGHIVWTLWKVQCIWQNRSKNAFMMLFSDKTLKLSRHPKELSIGHRDTKLFS